MDLEAEQSALLASGRTTGLASAGAAGVIQEWLNELPARTYLQNRVTQYGIRQVNPAMVRHLNQAIGAFLPALLERVVAASTHRSQDERNR